MSACSSCGAPDAPSICGGCKFAAYCEPVCQRAAWAGHKAVCKAIQADIAAAPDGDDMERTHCDSCAAKLDGREEVCAHCRSVSYCSAACQAAHWPAVHKAVCSIVGEAKFARKMALAKAGELGAMLDIACYYTHGTGVPRDKHKAISWSRRAAERAFGVKAEAGKATECTTRAAGASGDRSVPLESRDAFTRLRRSMPAQLHAAPP